MGVNLKAYSSIVLKNEADKIRLAIDLVYKPSELKDSFARARKGEDVVTPDGVSKHTGHKNALLHRSNPALPELDLKDDAAKVMDAIAKIYRGQSLTEADAVNHAIAREALTNKSGLPEETFDVAVEQASGILGGEENRLTRLFHLPRLKTAEPELIIDIVDALKSRVRDGKLDEIAIEKLAYNLATFGRLENISTEKLDEMVSTFEQRIRDRDSRLDYGKTLETIINNIRRSSGEMASHGYTSDKARSTVVVPDYDPGAKARSFFGFDGEDPIPRKIPGSTDQWEFVIEWHEDEHAQQDLTEDSSFKVPRDFNGNEISHAMEIDADYGMTRILDTLDGDMKDFWLKWRMVDSFKQGWSDTPAYRHDTATFLRYLEKTGEQLDLREFRKQKEALMDRIFEKTSPALTGKSCKISDLMGAVQDVLRDDRKEKIPIENLPICSAPKPFHFSRMQGHWDTRPIRTTRE